MDPEVFEVRTIEKMNFVDQVYSEAFRELTDEVDMFAQEVNERFAIRHPKYGQELHESLTIN